MKRQIFGRKEGTGDSFKLMIESDGATSGGNEFDPNKLRQSEFDNTRRVVKSLRDKAIEGYVLLEGDATHYVFTPSTDFVYPAT